MSLNGSRSLSQALNWWTSKGKVESVTQDRKRAALELYLYIASRAQDDIPEYSFPAAFDFMDGARYRPDKGVIKALIRSNVVEGFRNDDELLFRIVDRDFVSAV